MHLPEISPPLAQIAPAIIAGIIAAGSAIINRIAENRAQKKQNAANMALADKEFALNQTAVDKQNAYNSPVSQMYRYTEAGLNPNLIYGSGSASAGNQSSLASYNAPQAQKVGGSMPDFVGLLDQYQNFQMKGAQVDNVKALTENIRSRTLNEALRGNLLDVQGRTGEFDLDTKNMLRPYQASMAELGVRKSQINLKQEIERVALLKQAQMMNLLKSNQLKEGLSIQRLQQEKMQSEILYNKYRNDWMKQGVTTSDHPLLRMITRMMGNTGTGFDFSTKPYYPWSGF